LNEVHRFYLNEFSLFFCHSAVKTPRRQILIKIFAQPSFKNDVIILDWTIRLFFVVEFSFAQFLTKTGFIYFFKRFRTEILCV